MEHLSYLRKLYEYGETLSADELNEIVQYINTSIETINILIDREYAINNGHCEVRYKNSGQQPTKPSTGSNGYSDGWSATYTEPNTEQGESTWMSICFLNGNGEYGVWSSPVRITWGVVSGGGSGEGSGQGRDGEPGAFKSRVFKRQNTKPARPVGGSYSDPVPPGWYDGIPQGLAIIWSSVCTFYGDGTSSGWSDPAQESDTANLDIEYSPRTDCPPEPMGDIPFSNHEAEGWYDPNSPNFNSYEMIWRAERKVSNGVYDGPWVISCIIGEGGEQGPPGKTGGHHESRYKNHQITSANPVPIKPATGTDGTQNGWSIEQPSLTGEELLNGVATFMSQCFVNEDGEYGVWTLPMRITGENGKDGEDGDEVEFIYTRRESEWSDPQAPFSPQIDDWHGSYNDIVWTDNPRGVSREIPYEYVCQRSKINGTWYPYSVPAVWSKFGLNGRDGDGVEYVFIRTASDVAPTITNSDDTYDGKTYLDDDYLPLSSAGRCTDNPSGGNHNLPYEWVAKRSKGEPDIDSGARIWHKYSGTMSLWSTFTENTVRIDLDNETDSMLYSSSNGLVSGFVNSTGYLYDGQRDVSGYATWSIQSRDGCTASLNGRTIRVTEMDKSSGFVVLQAIYNGITYSATLTLKKIIDGDKYALIIRPNAISYNNSTNNPPTTTLDVEVWCTSVDGVREKTRPSLAGYTTYVIGRNTNGNTLITSNTQASFSVSINNSQYDDITIKIAKSQNASNDDCQDYETILINKVTNGSDGSQGPQGETGPQGPTGAQGQYEVKQYAISAYLTSSSGSVPPQDCPESGNKWKSTPPMTEVALPYLWQRVRMYNPATDSYSTSWAYMRVTGEIGTPGSAGQTGLWYSYAGVWGVDCGPGTNNPVKNTDKVGYYVQTQGGDFYMNTAPAGTENTNAPGEANWVVMQSDFKYIITKAVFSDYAQLGSFIINGDWFISKFGEICDHSQTLVNPTYVTIGENNYLDKYSVKIPYEWFDPTDPSGTTWVGYGITFAPNLAMDGKTGKVYFNRAYLKGQINATSGYIGDWKIENGNITASSSNCPYISLQQTGTSRHIRMGQPSGTFDTLLYSTNPEGKSITTYGSGTGGIGLQAYASTSGSTGVNVTALSDGSTGVSISKGNNSGRALEVTGGETYINTSKNTIYGDTIFDSGSISFRGSIKTSNFTLPESPITGTIFFCKGNNLTVTTRSHRITEGSDSSTLVSTYSSHNFEQTTFMLIFLGSEWALLYSA